MVFLLATACGGQGGGADAALGMDAAVPAPAPQVPDAGTDAGVLDAAVDPLDTLRAQIESLRELLEGRLPTDLDPQSLFEADLLDEQSRLERIQILQARLAVHAVDAGLPDAGILEDAAPPIDAGSADDAEVAEAGAPGDLDAGVAGDAG
ncbi:MAG: hypothetical protein KC619_06555 [Myxococcales bacterium]|nr:hypothetical protein [Myxococcales bacterium]